MRFSLYRWRVPQKRAPWIGSLFSAHRSLSSKCAQVPRFTWGRRQELIQQAFGFSFPIPKVQVGRDQKCMSLEL